MCVYKFIDIYTITVLYTSAAQQHPAHSLSHSQERYSCHGLGKVTYSNPGTIHSFARIFCINVCPTSSSFPRFCASPLLGCMLPLPPPHIFDIFRFVMIRRFLLFTTVPGSSINSWDSWFIFNLRKINTCYCMTYLIHEKAGIGCMLENIRTCVNNVTTVTLDVGFPAIFAIRLARRLKFLFTRCTQIEQCTYLGFVLLEAPREYVLHGPLLSIY
jgi:hypothetical protein